MGSSANEMKGELMNFQQKTNEILKKAVSYNEVSNYWYAEYEKSSNPSHLDYAMNAFQQAVDYLDCWSIMTDMEMDPHELDKFSVEDFEAIDNYNQRNGILC